MMNITASEVNKLRQTTGAGMMDCKNALVESKGDFDKALDFLRKKGQKVAANRADRESREGVVLAKVNNENTSGIIISLNCETDFVAKNEDYIKLANEIADLALNHKSLDSLLNANFNGISVNDKLTEQTGIIGEKIELKEFKRIDNNYVGYYIHAGNKIASLVSLSEKIEQSEELSKNIAMQVAAMNPISLDESNVDQKIIEKEIEIAKEQLRQEGKPDSMLDNIAKGKLKRFFKDNTLLNQNYIKENKISVNSYIKSISSSIEVNSFARVSLV
ncbi:MAG: translation elongation factor Ts [Flavobacteriaceae bacterium]